MNELNFHTQNIKEQIATKIKTKMDTLDINILDVFIRMYPERKNEIEYNKKIGDHQRNIDITRSVRNWSNGKSMPPLDDFLLLCKALECDPNYLLTQNTCSTEGIQYISNETGLSEKTIKFIKSQKANDSEQILFNSLCESEDGLKLCESLAAYIYTDSLMIAGTPLETEDLDDFLENINFFSAVGDMFSLSTEKITKLYRASIMNDIQYQLNRLHELLASNRAEEMLKLGIQHNKLMNSYSDSVREELYRLFASMQVSHLPTHDE